MQAVKPTSLGGILVPRTVGEDCPIGCIGKDPRVIDQSPTFHLYGGPRPEGRLKAAEQSQSRRCYRFAFIRKGTDGDAFKELPLVLRAFSTHIDYCPFSSLSCTTADAGPSQASSKSRLSVSSTISGANPPITFLSTDASLLMVFAL